MRRSMGLWVALAIVLPASVGFAQSQEDEAGDVSEIDADAKGPLRERIRPVSGHVFLKRQRFELSPSVGVSIKDAFFTKYLFGVTATYHFAETFALGLRWNYAAPVISGAAQICTVDNTGLNRTCRSPTWTELEGKVPGLVNMLGGLDVYWAPIYGKISLSSEAFLHFDMYALLGPTGVFYTGPDLTGATSKRSFVTAGANIGIGLRIFVTRWFALRTELRDVSYFETISSSTGTTAWRNQFMFDLGFSFFLPTNFVEE